MSGKAVKIAITNEKGGVGKTTTAVNVGSILSERGYKVLIVDLDPQTYTTKYFNLYSEDRASIYEVMSPYESAETDDAILHCGCEDKRLENLFILPSKYRFSDIDVVLMSLPRRQEYCLKKALTGIEPYFDYIILDCPANGDRIKENVYTYADYLVLPTIPDEFSFNALTRLATLCREVKEEVNPDIRIMGILPTMVEHSKDKREHMEVLRSFEALPCFNTAIRKNVKLSEAIKYHLPINIYDRKCNGFIDYNLLTDEIISITQKI